MSRFATLAPQSPRTAPRVADTVNRAGGEAFKQSPKLEFASLLLTSFLNDKYYESAGEGVNRLRSLLDQVDPKFAAKAAIYARNEHGIRSISHVTAAEIAARVKGEQWTKDFINSVVFRADDMTEILAYYLAVYGKPVPNALKKGLGLAFGKFDEYQLAKYRGEGKALSLVDVANIVHPVPTDKNAEALSKLINGTLRSEGTWESKLSEAGKSGADKAEAKAEAWAELVRSGKIGYFALLRNLRNIETQAPDLIDEAVALLTDAGRVRKSKVLPFRFFTALTQVSDTRFVSALSKAVDLSLANVPTFDGKTLVVIDHSASMGYGIGSNKFIGDVFAAAMFKANDADAMVFGSNAGYVRGLNPDDSTLTVASQIDAVNHGHGTDFHAIFNAADRGYDRVVIFSDMQGWIGYDHPGQAVENWKKRTKSDPFIYSFDLAGYGDMQFPEDRVFALAGFSEKVFDTMALLETDRQALVNTIEAIEL